MNRETEKSQQEKGKASESHNEVDLSVGEIAEHLRGLAASGRRQGVESTDFGEWRSRYQSEGFAGLRDVEDRGTATSRGTSIELATGVKNIAFAHPALGCNRIELLLEKEGVSLSSVTIQKILNENGIGTRRERAAALEEALRAEGFAPSAEQVSFLEKMNPCFRERASESKAPGKKMAADTIFLGKVTGLGKIYLHAMIDTFCSYAFGFLHPSKQPEASVACLHNQVLPHYRTLGIGIATIVTDGGREFCGTTLHPYELYLTLAGIQHVRRNLDEFASNGFAERFRQIVKEELVKGRLQGQSFETLEALSIEFDTWLREYNHLRPMHGYRNYGRTPFEVQSTHLTIKD